MVALEFLDCMEKDLNQIFKGMVFENSSNGKSGMHIFKQDFPIRKFRTETEEELQEDDIFPYCLVRVEEGMSGILQTVGITLTFGLCEHSEENNGEIRILNLIERVSQHFLNQRVIGRKFQLDYEIPIRWELPKGEENTYPYFFGLMEMTWNSFYEEKEDNYV